MRINVFAAARRGFAARAWLTAVLVAGPLAPADAQRGGDFSSTTVTSNRPGLSLVEIQAALRRAQRSPCERGQPDPTWVRVRRGVHTSGLADWGQLVNTVSGQDRLMGEHLADLRTRLEQFECETGSNLHAEATRLRRLVAPPAVLFTGPNQRVRPPSPPPPADCTLPSGYPPYVGAQTRFWRNTGFIDATAAISASWQKYRTDAANLTDLRERVDNARCELANAVELASFVAAQNGATALDASPACADVKPATPYSSNPPTPFAATAVLPQGGSVMDEYRYGQATSVWHRAQLYILDDLQTRLLTVGCLQGRLRNAVQATRGALRFSEVTQGTSIDVTRNGNVAGLDPSAPTAAERYTDLRNARVVCRAERESAYVSTNPDWGDAGVLAEMITVEIHRQRWYDTALEDLQAQLVGMRCEQQKLNDEMSVLSDRLDRSR